MTVQIITGCCLESMRTLPGESVQTCVTSPPYYGLRQYCGDSVSLKSSLTPEQKAWVEQQLREAGVHAHK